jgi:hypothetical protein
MSDVKWIVHLPKPFSGECLNPVVSDISDASAKPFSHRLLNADLPIHMTTMAAMTESPKGIGYDQEKFSR